MHLQSAHYQAQATGSQAVGPYQASSMASASVVVLQVLQQEIVSISPEAVFEELEASAWVQAAEQVGDAVSLGRRR